jgi:uncharacterized protein
MMSIFYEGQQGMNEKGSNLLGTEKSPYLRQHAGNPVWWRPWGHEAFAAAAAGDSPVFLSIGYSTCHWCHVMEKESFEDREVAALLNRSFIAVKVDREEHPDVDHIYMNAVQVMGQRGGWPLTVILTPGLRPFFGGTYFPHDVLLNLLREVERLWREEREKIDMIGSEVHGALARFSMPAGRNARLSEGEELLRVAFRRAKEEFDPVNGGFGSAPKFPPSLLVRLLLRIHRRTGDLEALRMSEMTLAAMARGGIYDHLGGGFARYSTDEKWLVPHFEKMLYDNALLATSYTEAFCATGTTLYENVARETLDYVLNDMTSPAGGFYSAEDADSEGKEGRFYVWTDAELRDALSAEEYDALCRVYAVSRTGNFEEGVNILSLRADARWEDRYLPEVMKARTALRTVQARRPRPLKDDKFLTAWNGLMIGAMARAHRAFGDSRYLDAAVRAAAGVRDMLWREGMLLRRYREGDARYPGTLDDYAFMIDGLLCLYEASADESWLLWAVELQGVQDRIFSDEAGGGYYYSPADVPHLLVRTKELTDSAVPNANAVSALNSLRLYHYMQDDSYRETAQGVFAAAGDLPLRYPGGFSQLIIAADFLSDDVVELTVAGKEGSAEFNAAVKNIFAHYLPNAVLAYAKENSLSAIPLASGKRPVNERTTLYVCSGSQCHAPVSDPDAAFALIGPIKRYEL